MKPYRIIFLVAAVALSPVLFIISDAALAGEKSDPLDQKREEIRNLKTKLLELSPSDESNCVFITSAILKHEALPEADKAVLEVLEKRAKDYKIVAKILETIGLVKRYKSFQDKLINEYFKHANEDVRKSAVKAAQALSDDTVKEKKDAADAFYKKLLEIARTTGTEEAVRISAVTALAGLERRAVESIPVLIEASRASKTTVVEAAVSAFKKLTYARYITRPDELPDVWEKLKDKPREQWLEDAINVFEKLLRAERRKFSKERIEWLKLLKKQNPAPDKYTAEYTAALKNQLEDEKYRHYPELRMYAAQEAARPGKSEFVRGLLKSFGDENPEVKEKVVVALGMIGEALFDNSSIIQKLRVEYDTAGGNGSLKGAIAVAIGRIGGANAGKPVEGEARDILIKKLDNEDDPVVLSKVVSAIGHVGSPDSVPALKMFLITNVDDKPVIRENLIKEIRNDAARTFGELRFGKTDADKKSEAVDCLLLLLKNDKEPSVRGTAAQSLGNIEAAGATGELIKALDAESETGVIQWIIVALGKIGDAEAVDPIFKVWKSNNPDHNSYVLPALRDIARKKGLGTAAAITAKMVNDAGLAALAEKFVAPLLPAASEISEEAKNDYYTIQKLLGRAHYMNKQWNKSRTAYQLAAGYFKDDYSIKESIADCFLESGDYAAAWNKFIELIDENVKATVEDRKRLWSRGVDCLRKLWEVRKDAAEVIEKIDAALKKKDKLTPEAAESLAKLKNEINKASTETPKPPGPEPRSK